MQNRVYSLVWYHLLVKNHAEVQIQVTMCTVMDAEFYFQKNGI